MKKILYIGLSFHLKTKSTQFFIDILKERFSVSFLWIDTIKQKYIGIDDAKGKTFDIIILFEVSPSFDFLTKNFKFTNIVYIPMYDAVANLNKVNYSLFEKYKDFGIISFSKTLYENLLERNYNVIFLKYFPVPQKVINWGKTDSVFFWQRRSNINIKTVVNLLPNFPIKHIHIHKALDPNNLFVKPNIDSKYTYTYSEWFDDKCNMDRVMDNSAIYIAPRNMEGIGMSFLGAMAHGRCVIAPNVPTMNEYIENGKNGLLYDIDNVKALERTDIRTIQKNALITIQEGYSKWETNKKNILDWLDNLNYKIRNTQIISKEKTDDYNYIKKRETNKIPSQEGQSEISENSKNVNERLYKFRRYFYLLIDWLTIEIEGTDFDAYFRKNNIKIIAIYGAGRIGNLFLQKLKKTSSVQVAYMIDKKVSDHNEIPILSPTEKLPEVDAIVVTTNYIFDEIKESLASITSVPIVCIDDVIEAEMNSEESVKSFLL